jgi:hypothetical protein
MLIRRPKHAINIPFKIYSAGDYLLLYDALANYNWAPLYKESSVDAVGRLNTAVTEIMDLAIPSGPMRNNKHPS